MPHTEQLFFSVAMKVGTACGITDIEPSALVSAPKWNRLVIKQQVLTLFCRSLPCTIVMC